MISLNESDHSQVSMNCGNGNKKKTIAELENHTNNDAKIRSFKPSGTPSFF